MKAKQVKASLANKGQSDLRLKIEKTPDFSPGKLMKKLPWQKSLVVLFLLPIVALIFLNIASVATLDLVEGDTASLVVMATAPVYGLGVPYNTFWELKPPGIFLLVGSLVKFFGFSMMLLKLTQVLLLLGIAVFAYFILKKIFTPLFLFLVGWFALVVISSPDRYDIFLPSELFGLFFSLAGLTALLYVKGYGRKFFLAVFLLMLSGQMKDPFAYTLLAILPPLIFLLIRKEFKNFLISLVASLGGVLVVVLLMLVYLEALGVTASYLGVLNYKSIVYDAGNFDKIIGNFQYATQKTQDIIINFQYYNSLPFIMWILATITIGFKSGLFQLSKIKNNLSFSLKFKISEHTENSLAVLFYSLGSFFGYTAAGRIGGHYALQAILPLYFIQGTFFNSIYNYVKDFFNRGVDKTLLTGAVIIISLVFLMSKPAYLKPYLSNFLLYKNDPFKAVTQIYAANRQVGDWLTESDKEKIDKNSCLLRVYGWGASTAYFYSQMKPCTRFFLANIVKMDWQRNEYRDSILQNPPGAILYSREQADMDVPKFEREVINIYKILENCYLPPDSPDGAYLPRFNNKNEMKNCLGKNK